MLIEYCYLSSDIPARTCLERLQAAFQLCLDLNYFRRFGFTEPEEDEAGVAETLTIVGSNPAFAYSSNRGPIWKPAA